MHRLIHRSTILGMTLLLASAAVGAADWPQWRGAERNGKSAETGLLPAWPEGGPPLAWRATGVGAGYASMSVVGDHIYTLGDLPDGQYVIALARADGGPRWKTKIGSVWDSES